MRKKKSNELDGEVMKSRGYALESIDPNAVKYEIAEEQGIPLTKGDNGHLTSKQAGKIGGSIGGNMVKDMVKKAQEQLKGK